MGSSRTFVSVRCLVPGSRYPFGGMTGARSAWVTSEPRTFRCFRTAPRSQLFITSPDEEEEAEEDPPSSFKPLPPKNLSRLRRVQANQHGWCAIKADGSIVTWGWPAHESLNEIWKPIPRKYFKGPFTEISANLDAFAGIQEDGNLVIWGRNDVYPGLKYLVGHFTLLLLFLFHVLPFGK